MQYSELVPAKVGRRKRIGLALALPLLVTAAVVLAATACNPKAAPPPSALLCVAAPPTHSCGGFLVSAYTAEEDTPESPVPSPTQDKEDAQMSWRPGAHQVPAQWTTLSHLVRDHHARGY